MAKSDGQVIIDTSLDTAGIKAGLGKLTGLIKTGVTGAVGLLGGVATALTGAAGAGIKYNAEMEQYFGSFETMFGSAEKAQGMMENLKTFAAKTPFEMPGIADATTTLLSFGVAEQDVMGIMQKIGDVSLGNQEKFKGLALVYGQVMSNGKLMGQDLLQMINQGFNPLQVISEKTGKSMAELKDEMSKGQITSEMVAQAFAWATEEGGKFSGGMEKQSRTAKGLFSTLQDNVSALIGKVVEPTSEGITKTLLPSAISAIEGMTEAFEKDGMQGLIRATGKAFADAVTGIAQQAPQMVKLAVEFVKSFIAGINENKTQILQGAWELVKAFAQGITELLPKSLQKPFKDAFAGMAKSVESGGIKEAIKTVVKIFESLTKVVSNIAKAVLPVLVKALDFVGKNLKYIVPLATAFFVAMKGYKVISFASSAISTFSVGITAMKAALAGSATFTTALTAGVTAMTGATGANTVAVGLATKAQALWNAAMTANPVGLLVTGLGVLVGAIAVYSTTMSESSEVEKEFAKDMEETQAAIDRTKGACEEYRKALTDTSDTVAQTDFSPYDTKAADESKQEMQTIADKMYEIHKNAKENHDVLTEEQIKSLEDLLNQYIKHANLVADAALNGQGALSTAIKNFVQQDNLSVEEFEAQAARYVAAAQKKRDDTQTAEDERCQNILAMIEAERNAGTISQEEATARNEEAIKLHQEHNAAIKAQYDQQMMDLANAQLAKNTTYEALKTDFSNFSADMQTAEADYNARKKELQDAQAQGNVQAYYQEQALDADFEAKKKEHYSKLVDEMTDEETATLNHWLSMLKIQSENGTAITDEQAAFAKGIIDAMKDMPNDASNKFKEMMDSAGITLSTEGDTVSVTANETGKKISGQLKAGVEAEKESVRTAGKNVAQAGKDGMAEVDATQTGTDLVGGLISGINAGAGSLTAAMGNIARNALASARQSLEIRSPSRKFARLVGRYIPEGIAMGVEKNAGGLMGTIRGLSDDMLSQMDRIDYSAAAGRFRQAVYGAQAQLGLSVSAYGSASHIAKNDLDYDRIADGMKESMRSVRVQVDSHLNGKVVAREMAPLINDEQGFGFGIKTRGGAW